MPDPDPVFEELDDAERIDDACNVCELLSLLNLSNPYWVQKLNRAKSVMRGSISNNPSFADPPLEGTMPNYCL